MTDHRSTLTEDRGSHLKASLAPGLIGMIGASLAQPFRPIGTIELKVGASLRHPGGLLLSYAFCGDD